MWAWQDVNEKCYLARMAKMWVIAQPEGGSLCNPYLGMMPEHGIAMRWGVVSRVAAAGYTGNFADTLKMGFMRDNYLYPLMVRLW